MIFRVCNYVVARHFMRYSMYKSIRTSNFYRVLVSIFKTSPINKALPIKPITTLMQLKSAIKIQCFISSTITTSPFTKLLHTSIEGNISLPNIIRKSRPIKNGLINPDSSFLVFHQPLVFIEQLI